MTITITHKNSTWDDETPVPAEDLHKIADKIADGKSFGEFKSTAGVRLSWTAK